MWNKVKKVLHKIFIEYFGLVIVGLLAVDIITKYVMEGILKNPGSSIELIPGLLEFQLVYNKGAFAGMLGGTVGHILLILISILGTGVMTYGLIKYRYKINKGMLIGIIMALPGCFGNLIDRVIYVNGEPRGVIDFIHFYIDAINFDWPVFNVADMLLVVGTIVFAVFYFIYDSKLEKEKKAKLEEIEKQKMEELNSTKEETNNE
ncbi:MAG: signal peptidase II [Erysipelotrichaceae bacterium]|nr:signal peptidase II [Erysipelotrichaceae bacterium]